MPSRAIAASLLWWTPAVAIFVVWCKLVRQHEFWVSAWHVALFALAVFGAYHLWHLAAQAVKGLPGSLWVNPRVVVRRSVLVFLAGLGILEVATLVALTGWVPCMNLNLEGQALVPERFGRQVLLVERRNLRGARARHALFHSFATGLEGRGVLRFTGSDFRRATFDSARIGDVNFDRCTFDSASFRGAESVEGYGPSMLNAKFICADLVGARMSSCNLSGADFRGADLTDATIGQQNTSRSNADSCDFRGARLLRASVTNTSLGGARLSFADLRCATVEGHVRDIVYADARWSHSWSADSSGSLGTAIQRSPDWGGRAEQTAVVVVDSLGEYETWRAAVDSAVRTQTDLPRWFVPTPYGKPEHCP